MPQFDFANVFLPQLVWLAIFFAVLYFAVVLPTLPKLGRTMQAREDQVTGDLDAAEAAKASADKLAADYEAGVAEAQESGGGGGGGGGGGRGARRRPPPRPPARAPPPPPPAPGRRRR
ncbi:hypothetical protein ACCC88_19540, partial [Sphingomonas sp. Sphisp140]